MNVEKAIADALSAGKAICKFITRNNVGATGSHECGYYLPKSVWQMFTAQPPVRGVNHTAAVRVEWGDGSTTNSCVKWYGKGTRSEYRLTSFGRGFPWLSEELVGSLLVIVPISLEDFHAYVFQEEDEIEQIRIALGIEMLGGFGIYSGGKARTEEENECLTRVIGKTVSTLCEFPDGRWMAEHARESAIECIKEISRLSADDQLLRWVKTEYQLFRAMEQKLCGADIRGPFSDVDDFIKVAATLMNRRKSRAGHSLEHHVEHLLSVAGLPFDRQPTIDGKVRPDLLIPGKAAYEDKSFPVSHLVVVGLKTTCKDRWRQVLNEGRRVPEKHLLTLQEGISTDQLIEMRDANVTLVVPKPFHKDYDTKTGIRLLTIQDFMEKVRALASGKNS